MTRFFYMVMLKEGRQKEEDMRNIFETGLNSSLSYTLATHHSSSVSTSYGVIYLCRLWEGAMAKFMTLHLNYCMFSKKI